VIRVTYETTAPSATQTFTLSNSAASNAAAYSEVQFTLKTSVRTYNDVLRLNIWPQFSQVYMTHNSLTTSQYDYLFVNFQVSASIAPVANSQTSLVLDLLSRYYSTGAANSFEDLGTTTDANMFLNQPSGAFVNGQSYPFKLYVGGVDVTSTLSASNTALTMHFGQWRYGETPVTYRLNLGTLTLTAGTSY
jgi:hypothetical protein